MSFITALLLEIWIVCDLCREVRADQNPSVGWRYFFRSKSFFLAMLFIWMHFIFADPKGTYYSLQLIISLCLIFLYLRDAYKESKK